MSRSALALLLALLIPAVSAQVVARAQEVGAGSTTAATGPGVIVSSWVGMGLMSPPATNGSQTAGSGIPQVIIPPGSSNAAGEEAVIQVILGLVRIEQIGLHQRDELDGDRNGVINAADVVREVNAP